MAAPLPCWIFSSFPDSPFRCSSLGNLRLALLNMAYCDVGMGFSSFTRLLRLAAAGISQEAKKSYLLPQRTASQPSFAVGSPMPPWTAHQAIQPSSSFTIFCLAVQSWVDDFPNLRLSQYATLPFGFHRRINWVMTVRSFLRLYLCTAVLPRAGFITTPYADLFQQSVRGSYIFTKAILGHQLYEALNNDPFGMNRRKLRQFPLDATLQAGIYPVIIPNSSGSR